VWLLEVDYWCHRRFFLSYLVGIVGWKMGDLLTTISVDNKCVIWVFGLGIHLFA
jgi:hypothetical protein